MSLPPTRINAGFRAWLARVDASGMCFLALALTLLAGCGSAWFGKADYGWIGGSSRGYEGQGVLRLSWARELTPARRGAYLPVENAVAAIDIEHARVYVGAVSGKLYALGFDGRHLYHYDLHEAIECEPAIDPTHDELYVGTERGELYALAPGKGSIRWRVEIGSAIRRRPLLFHDAVYVVTEDDAVEALSRADGTVLWRYQRERDEGFLVAGHAGLMLDGQRLVTAFNDGLVVALDVLDGSVKWERDTSVEVPEVEPGRPRYTDVDTTPVRVGDALYVASFGAGLYALDPHNGSVLYREAEWTGVTSLAASADATALFLVSADRGLVRFDLATRGAVWMRPEMRGSLAVPVIEQGVIVLGESKGSLLAIDGATGDELSRIDAGHGFVAATAIGAGRGFAVTNGGTLLALRFVH